MQSLNSPIFYHEDLYRQIEFVPEENYFTAGRFLNELLPKESSTYGTFNITVRPEQKTKLLDRKIQIKEIKKILDPTSLYYSENVQTGYGHSTWADKNSIVWGFEQFGIFVKYQKDFVEAIWIADSPAFPQKRTSQHLTKAIFKVSKAYSLILIDWNQELLCRISSEKVVEDYLCQYLSFDCD
jgi:hypothetical protein